MHLQGVAKSSRKKCAMLSVGTVSYLHVCRRPLQREFAKLSGSLLSVSGLKHSCRRLRTLMPCGQCTHLSCYSQVSQEPALPHTLPGLAAPIPHNPQNWPRLRFLRSLALPARSAEHEMTRKLFRLLSQGQYASVSRSTLARKINEQHKALQPLKRKYFESKGLPLHDWTTRLLPRFGQTGCLRTVCSRVPPSHTVPSGLGCCSLSKGQDNTFWLNTSLCFCLAYCCSLLSHFPERTIALACMWGPGRCSMEASCNTMQCSRA